MTKPPATYVPPPTLSGDADDYKMTAAGVILKRDGARKTCREYQIRLVDVDPLLNESCERRYDVPTRSFSASVSANRRLGRPDALDVACTEKFQSSICQGPIWGWHGGQEREGKMESAGLLQAAAPGCCSRLLQGASGKKSIESGLAPHSPQITLSPPARPRRAMISYFEFPHSG